MSWYNFLDPCDFNKQNNSLQPHSFWTLKLEVFNLSTIKFAWAKQVFWPYTVVLDENVTKFVTWNNEKCNKKLRIMKSIYI